MAKDKSLPFCNYHVKRVAPTAEVEGGVKLDTVSENGEQEPEGEDVEVEGDDGEDINLMSGDEVSVSGEDRSPNGEPLVV